MPLSLISIAWVLCLATRQSNILDAATLHRLDETRNIQMNAGFTFSVSPNNRWLVFFALNESEVERKEVDGTYGLLRILDLKDGQARTQTIREAHAPHLMENIDAVWGADSSTCVLPPPPVKDNRVVVNLGDGNEPSLAFVPERQRPVKPGDAVPAPINLPERFTCSDCSPRSEAEDEALMQKLIPPEFYSPKPPEGQATSFATRVVSHDGKKVYYQRGPQKKSRETNRPVNLETTLHEIDAETGNDRMLVSHAGECARIQYLRPSPDGRRLAYTVTSGCGFVSIPEIFVLDLASGKTAMIALGGGAMRWSSTSDKLYFFRRWDQGDHGHYLWVAEFGPPAPAARPKPAATTKPASTPATQPAVK